MRAYLLSVNVGAVHEQTDGERPLPDTQAMSLCGPLSQSEERSAGVFSSNASSQIHL